jgi:hypothetical protein
MQADPSTCWQWFAFMGVLRVVPSAMLAAVFAIVPLWPGSAAAASRHEAFLMPPARPAVGSAMIPVANPVGRANQIHSPQGVGRFKPTLPVADRTVIPAPTSHHPTPRHYKPVRHSNKMAQQYYQPARQYYQWHMH